MYENILIKQEYSSISQTLRPPLTWAHSHLVSCVADSSYPCVLRQQISEDPAHLRNTEEKL